MKMSSQILLIVSALSGFAGCGYHFQNTRNQLEEQYGVRKVYVRPLRNETFKPGVDNLVYNRLLLTISRNRRVKLVSSIEDADAVLSGKVTQAAFDRGVEKAGDQLFGTQFLPDDQRKRVPGFGVATDYNASLNCEFNLQLVQQWYDPKKYGPGKLAAPPPTPTPRPGSLEAQRATGQVIWSGNFSRTKPFPASNQVGAFGTTSSLINESEFDRALGDLAESMMADLHESMMAMF
jgi:hypothetical protein